MSTRQFLLDVAQCLRAAATPLLTLGVLTLARTTHTKGPTLARVDELFLLGWRAAMIARLLWLLIAVIWAATRPLRDRHAFQRLQRLREIGTPADRALVHVQTAVWSSTAGQDVVVVNVETGQNSRVWLPETTVPIGAFVVLERTDGGVSVVDWMNAHQVEAGHRHEQRNTQQQFAARPYIDVPKPEQQKEDAGALLIRETEEFLQRQRE